MKNITVAKVGEALADIFINIWKSPKNIEKFKREFSISTSNDDVYLYLAALYFMAFIRASQCESIKIQPHLMEKISHNLASFLIAKYLVLHNISTDVCNVLLETLNTTTEYLICSWDENLNRKPGPHWYVSKDICKYLLPNNPDSPNLPLIVVLSDFLSNDSISIKKFLEELGKEYSIVE